MSKFVICTAERSVTVEIHASYEITCAHDYIRMRANADEDLGPVFPSPIKLTLIFDYVIGD